MRRGIENRRHIALATILFHGLLRRMGPDQRLCHAFPRTISLEPVRNGVSGCRASAARRAGPNPDGHADRPFWRAHRIHSPDDRRRGAGVLTPSQATYSGLVAIAFMLGLAGSSFAIGVGYVSRWSAPERQGAALGIYGLGNAGRHGAVCDAVSLAGNPPV